MPFRTAGDSGRSVFSARPDPCRWRSRQRRVSDAVSSPGPAVSARSPGEYFDTRAGVRVDAADSRRAAGYYAPSAPGSEDLPQDDAYSAGESVRFLRRDGRDVSAPATRTRTAAPAVRLPGKALRRAHSGA